MQLKKYAGCLLTLVFAAATAFADATPTWFSATIGAELASPWSGSTGAAYWTYADGVGKLNNMSATGDNAYLTYTAATQKSLPGDESTFTTSVKFTAMDKADFFDANGNAPAIPSGAKGGLTLIEDCDANPATTNFYAIVDGVWTNVYATEAVKLAALSQTVPVVVKIWENNGKKISYSVNGTALTLDSASTMTAAFSGTTLGEVSYKGVCEIASLQGDATDELWTLTLKVITDATAYIKIGSGEWTTAPASIKGTTETVQVKYETAKYFFPQTTGAGVQELVNTATQITGNTDFTADTAFANVSAAEDAVAEVVTDGSGFYKSVGAAVAATGSGVNVLKNTTGESVTVGKSMTLTANENVTIVGTFTKSTGGVLTIDSGSYDCDFNDFDATSLILNGGLYTQAAADVQRFCAANRFAGASGVATYITKVEPGSVIAATGDVPAMNVDKGVDAAAQSAGCKDTATYLAQPIASGSSVQRWQTYALGLGTAPTAADVPEFTATNDTDAAAIHFVKNFEVLKSAGVAVTYGVDDATPTTDEPTIALSDINGVVTKSVKVYTNGKLAGSTTIGANKIATTAETRTLVTVPWARDNAGDGLSLGELFKNTALANGDKVEIHDADDDVYVTWTWNGTAWVNSTVVDGDKSTAEIPTLTRGQALWFTGAAAGNIYQMGTSLGSAAATQSVKAEKWGFVAVPVDRAASTKVADIANNSATLQVQVENAGKATVFYKDTTSGAWGYDDYYKKNGDKWAKKQFKAAESSEMTVAPGKSCWILNGGSSAADVSL